MSGFSGGLYIPENEFDIEEGYYSVNEVVELLRKHRNQPDVVFFIADMLEV
jgi:hypothetical protein